MRRLPLLLMTLLLLGACVGQGRYRPVLDDAAQLVNDRPDSVVTLLRPLEGETSHFSVGTLMRYHLLRLMAENKCRTVFRSDSLQRVLTDYYDRHGTPNERMWAHYLLGRAYYCMGEALPALEQYQAAAAAADTTSSDCDYWNLTRVKLHEVLILYHQKLPHEVQDLLTSAEQTAIKAHDTLSAILCQEKKAMVYELEGKGDSMALAGLVASIGYRNAGHPTMSARALYWVIPFNIENGDYNMARKNLETYERESGFFNGDNEISEEKKHFYALKGRYFLGIDKLDSAEIFFRKCLATQKVVEHTVENTYFINLRLACKGLAALYDRLGRNDSVAKYAKLSEAYNDSIYKYSYMSEALAMSQVYDYSMHVLKEKDLNSHLHTYTARFRLLVWVLAVVTLLALALAFKWFGDRRRFRAEMEKMRHQKDMLDAMKELEERIAGTEILVGGQRKTPDDGNRRVVGESIMQSEIFRKIIGYTMENSGETMTNDDWDELEHTFDDAYPQFKTMIGSKLNGATTEYRFCILVKLGLSSFSINKITGNRYKNITVIKKRIYKKVTGKEGGSQDFDLLIKSID